MDRWSVWTGGLCGQVVCVDRWSVWTWGVNTYPHPCTWGSTPTPTPAPGGQHLPPPLYLGVNTYPPTPFTPEGGEKEERKILADTTKQRGLYSRNRDPRHSPALYACLQLHMRTLMLVLPPASTQLGQALRATDTSTNPIQLRQIPFAVCTEI